MDPQALVSTSSPLPNRPAYSCIRCSDRKVKCDRQHPCSACVKHGAECVFRPTQPLKKRQKQVKKEVWNNRLNRYKASLQEQGIDPTALPNVSATEKGREFDRARGTEAEHVLQLPTLASTVSEPQQPITKTQLLHKQGRPKFVDNGLWTQMIEEFNNPEEALKEALQEESGAEESEDDSSYVLGFPLRPTTRLAHPPIDHIHELWQIFVDNVDPLTKVVHVPTLQSQVKRAAADLGILPKGFEALLFAIYSMAILSLRNEECQKTFGEPRKILLSRYISATKAALSQAKFMGTTNIIVLQALVLHILSVRDVYDPRTLWTLTGVAMRIAEGIGLHRDGSSLALPPFESEIRRRIWWQITMHDVRTAELGGLVKFRNFDGNVYTPKRVANINDGELYPGMSSPAAESTGLTDMIFCVFKSELGCYVARNIIKVRQQGNDGFRWDDPATRDGMKLMNEIVDEIEEILETKYLRFCDPSQPLQLMTMIFARSAVDTGRFVARHPRRWGTERQIPESERQYVWDLSIKLLERYNMMQSTSLLQRFSWHAAYYFHWHSFIHILETLRANPLMPDATKTWQLVESAYGHNPDMITNTKKPYHVAVGNLCLKAWNSQEAALVQHGKPISSVPEHITQLRKQRETAKGLRQRYKIQCNETDASNTITAASHQLIDNSNGKNLLRDTNPASQVAELHLPQDSADCDAFEFTNGVEEGLFSISESTTDMDSYFMLAQNHSFEGTTEEVFDWARWDALIGG